MGYLNKDGPAGPLTAEIAQWEDEGRLGPRGLVQRDGIAQINGTPEHHEG